MAAAALTVALCAGDMRGDGRDVEQEPSQPGKSKAEHE
jgi:hypothetical protein